MQCNEWNGIGIGLTRNVIRFVDDALESGEDEVSVNKVSDEAFHGGTPRVGIRLVG